MTTKKPPAADKPKKGPRPKPPVRKARTPEEKAEAKKPGRRIEAAERRVREAEKAIRRSTLGSVTDVKDGNELENPPAPELPDISKLTWRQQLFCHELVIDHNGLQAAIRAGYSPASAGGIAYSLRQNPIIAAWEKAHAEDRVTRAALTRENILTMFEDVALADHNELAEYRRQPCRFCYAPGVDQPLMTPAEYEAERREWNTARASGVAAGIDIGEFQKPVPDVWYDSRPEPNKDCLQCRGDGDGRVHFHDTRYLSRRARLLYAGAKIGKDGIEIKSLDKTKFLDGLAKHHKLYEDSTTNVNIKFDKDELDRRFQERYGRAVKRQGEVDERRGTGGDDEN